MTEFEQLKQQYDTLDKEAGKYNRPEFDQVYEIIKELVQDRQDVGDNGNLALPLVQGDVIDEALQRAGFSNDEDFVSDFLKYREIDQAINELRIKRLSLIIEPISITPEPTNNGWRFLPIYIWGPKCMHDRIKAEGIQGKGLFKNKTDILEEDEIEDDLLLIDKFGMDGNLLPYCDDLMQYKVIGPGGFLNDELKHFIFTALKDTVSFIKDNTNAPAKVRNHIRDIIILFDKVPTLGLPFQILILQGLCRWIEGARLSKDNNGLYEVQRLYDWIIELLHEKEKNFCRTPYGNNDKKLLKPLCDYLYSTELGQIVQAELFGEKPLPKKQVKCFPNEFDTKEAKDLFQNLIKTGFCDEAYIWKKPKGLLAYFADRASEYLNLGKGEYDGRRKTSWKPFEQLFNSNKLAEAKKDYQKTGVLPIGYETIDQLFQ